MRAYFWVAAGGAMGAVLRALISTLFPLLHNFHIVWVNIVGSFLLAIIFSSFSVNDPFSQKMRWMLGTGVMGGFTTMSTFSLDIVMLIEKSLWTAAAYMLVSIIGGLLAAVLGVFITTTIRNRKLATREEGREA